MVDENIARTNVPLIFTNSSLKPNAPGYLLKNIESHIRLEFDQTIRNQKL